MRIGARRRYLILGKQQPDGISELRGRLDPEGRATIEAVFAKLAAPGMCNPCDESPCVDGDPSTEAAASDTRSTGQRNHDALTAMGRTLLASGALGSHNGLPVTMVISTTLQQLESGKGYAFTGGGCLLPMSEVIRQASSAHHYLAVFDKRTEEPLYLGRAKRLASKAQPDHALRRRMYGCYALGGRWPRPQLLGQGAKTCSICDLATSPPASAVSRNLASGRNPPLVMSEP